MKYEHREHQNPYLIDRSKEETFLYPLPSGHQKPAPVGPQKPTQTMTVKSNHTPSKAAAAAAAAPSSMMNMLGNKATNVIERRGEHNKNLDEPFLPRANNPKVFVSEPKLNVPLSSQQSIYDEFKRQPAYNIAKGNFYTNNHLDMLEAVSAAELEQNHLISDRIQNFKLYEDILKRKQHQQKVY